MEMHWDLLNLTTHSTHFYQQMYLCQKYFFNEKTQTPSGSLTERFFYQLCISVVLTTLGYFVSLEK